MLLEKEPFYIRDLREHMDKKFGAIDARFDEVDKKFGAVDARFDGVDEKLRGMDKRFDDLEKAIGEGFHVVHERIDRVEATIEKIETYIGRAAIKTSWLLK